MDAYYPRPAQATTTTTNTGPRQLPQPMQARRPKQTFAETLHAGGGDALVRLDPDHPGFSDKIYRQRRNTIARQALEYREGKAVPDAEYIAQEHAVWREVWQHLGPLHDQYAAREYLAAQAVLPLGTRNIPQLQEVNDQLQPVFGFQMLPVAGLVEAGVFLRYLGHKIFLSTQYIRHYSRPLYTPEPDIVHELVGYAATFTNKAFVDLNVAFGEAADRARDPELVARIGRLYWFTLEFGVVREGQDLKALGAGLLSSFGELGRFVAASELRRFTADAAAAQPYDPTGYQDVLFVADSFAAMSDATMSWLARI